MNRDQIALHIYLSIVHKMDYSTIPDNLEKMRSTLVNLARGSYIAADAFIEVEDKELDDMLKHA